MICPLHEILNSWLLLKTPDSDFSVLTTMFDSSTCSRCPIANVYEVLLQYKTHGPLEDIHWSTERIDLT